MEERENETGNLYHNHTAVHRRESPRADRPHRYLAELVVRHDDTLIVVVPDVVEEAHAVGGRKVLLRGIEDAGVGVGRLIGERF